ncbi:hypothetical protein [Telluria aromaticivorans]|uniref:Uncharacterized protein n=1 Tax=Telluria aromaticivorans TaxID=2725995 RepID=A0A7Y2NYP0_9BURK|nr:hypothetical protein [Telluria aromaticivorans]NNG21701.1 hypothetical protein [Telluria aromaticivorans]
MVLPELSSQFVYARIGWALVFACLIAAAWPAAWRLPRRTLAAILGGSSILMALPGAASPAWHLGLAFQYPSGLLLGLCLVKLHARWAGAPRAALMPPAAAAVLAVAGTCLYLDAAGLLSRGYYYAGFGPDAAPALAALLAGACAIAVLRGQARPQACALLVALSLFSLARLPSGNLWDALLDPLLWGWAVAALCAAGLRRLRVLPRRANPVADGAQEAPGLRPAGAEPFLPMKE